jgi:cytochrome c-type biogenesis protein CcmH
MCRSWLLMALMIAMWSVRSAYGIDATSIADPALEARYLELTHELRCMQCQNESIADSPVGLASDLRREVRNMLLAGKTDDEVRDYMVSRYGEFILFRPRFSARNAWLWLAPPLFLLIGLGVAVRVVRQRAALAATDPDVPDDDGRS